MSAASSRGGGGGAAGGGSGNGGRGGGGQKKGFGLAGTVGETNKQQKQGGVAGLEALVLARAENSFNHQLPDEDAEGQRGQAPGGRQRRPRQGPQPPSSLTAQFMHVPSGPSFYQNLPPGGSAGTKRGSVWSAQPSSVTPNMQA